MPKGKTHDKISFLLVLPTFLATYFYTQDLNLSVLVTIFMLFGGLMFGPDLDINSKQYQRWGPLRFLWLPYQKIFSHRSPFTHGIFLGTLVRIGYFFLVITLVTIIISYAWLIFHSKTPDLEGLIIQNTNQILILAKVIPKYYLMGMLIGVWLGATSHTIADLLTTAFKQIVKSL